jgi:hypothetical protein
MPQDLVICGSPDTDPEKLLIFTPAWQSGANFSGIRESQMVPKFGLFFQYKTGKTMANFQHQCWRMLYNLSTVNYQDLGQLIL